MTKNIITFFLFLILGLPSQGLALDQDELRYYYVGKIGVDQSIQLELSVQGKGVRGSYYNDKTGVPIPILGEVNFDDSTITLSTKGNGRKFTGKFEPMNGVLGTSIEGVYTLKDSLMKIPFQLTKVANYESFLIKQIDKVETSWSYPKLISKNEVIQNISPKLSERMKPEIDEFQKNAKEAFLEDLISEGYQFSYNYSIEYYSVELISFVGQVYSYTGGAHGNTYFVSSNYWIKDGDTILLKLRDLFKKDSKYEKILSDYIINELRKKGAGWVVNGEIKTLKTDEMGPFAISPRGIQFAFAPYAVGSYAEGAYFVTISFENLYNIINLDGPLSSLVKPSDPTAQNK